MVVAVLCMAWLVLSLPLALVLGSALRRADVLDRRDDVLRDADMALRAPQAS
ncbi:hypothetical protein ACI78R_18075 [Geodermatophilus sp. SYSU D01106]